MVTRIKRHLKWLFNGVYTRHLILPVLTLLLAIALFIYLTEYWSMILSALTGFLIGKSIIDITMVYYHFREDNRKAIRDYEGLEKYYDTDYYGQKRIVFTKKPRLFSRILKRKEVLKEFKLYYEDLLTNHKAKNICFIDNPTAFYKVPDIILPYYAELLSAHAASYTENAITYRLMDEPNDRGESIGIKISRTRYFDHLVMNRAIDFTIGKVFTVRKLCEFKKRLSPLSDEVLPNQIGVNAIVLFSDGRTIIPKRSLLATVAKNKVTSSLAIRLDAEDQSVALTEEMVHANFKKEMKKRLGFSDAELKTAYDIQLIGIGRDLYEAGKPQFYFTINFHNLPSDTYIRRLKAIHKQRKKDRGNQIDYDRQLIVCDFNDIKLKKEKTLSINSYKSTKKGNVKQKRRRKSVKPEMSFFFNLWHFYKIHEKHKIKEPS